MSDSNKKAEELASLILSGQSTISEMGTACKSMQTGMAVAMLAGLNSVYESVSKSSQLLDKLTERFYEKLEADVQADAIDTEGLLLMIERIRRSQLNVLDLQRKIVQGKELIPEQTLSDEEKVVIKLFKSFKSKDEKEKFIGVVNDFMSKNKDDDNEFGD